MTLIRHLGHLLCFHSVVGGCGIVDVAVVVMGNHPGSGATFIFGSTNVTTWSVCSHTVYKHP